MSKIVKKMKIMQPGGTFSDYVPIGAEAENINVDGESVETKLGKKPYYYDTVADMKADTKLKTGDMAVTLGYYSVNDEGGAEYKIVNSTSNYYESLINNLKAELIVENEINVKQLGVYGDNVHDDTSVINNAILLNKPLYFPSGIYLISETINVTNNICIIGNGKTTIFNSTNNTLYPVIDFSSSNEIYLKNFTTNNSSFKIMPDATQNKTSRELMYNKVIYISNVTCDTINENIKYKTNWQGLFINNPQPNHFSPRDFQDGKYARYGIQIFNNSGYNGIDVDNRIQDENGNYLIVQDNSAIGIVDGVLGSTPALFMDMHAERCAIGIKNRTATASPSSLNRPDTVYEVGYNGHLAIGCSVYDETGASGVGTVKLKDNNPSIRFYDTNYPNNICMIREKDNQFQFLANGTLCSHYNSNLYHEYKKPLKIDDLVTTGGGLILGSTAFNGSDYHIFVDNSGILRINRTNTDVAQTTEAGYAIQVNKSGTSTNRPTGLSNDWQSIGTMYFDTTIGKPIWWNGTSWVDATGTNV